MLDAAQSWEVGQEDKGSRTQLELALSRKVLLRTGLG